jgi:small-conductance mechanosensitive channel
LDHPFIHLATADFIGSRPKKKDQALDTRSMRNPPQRLSKHLLVIVLAVTISQLAAPCVSFGQAPAGPQQVVEPAPSAAIPAAEVATKATEVTNLLATVSAKFASISETEKIRQSFHEISTEIERELYNTERTLGGKPTLATLQTQQTLWKSRQAKVRGWLDLLTKRAVELREELDGLAGLQATWIQTRDAARASKAPEATLQQIETVLNAIAAAKSPLQAQREGLLSFQSRISDVILRCDDVLSRIVQAQKGAVTGILTHESPPIWNAEQWGYARASLPTLIDEIAASFRRDLLHYFRDPLKEMPLHICLFAVLAGLFTAARRSVRRWTSDARKAPSFASVFERPYAAAMLAVWFIATRYDSPIPPMVKELFAVLALIPIVRLVQPALSPRLMPGIYALAALYALDILIGAFGGEAVVEQVLLLLEGLAGLMVLGWLLTSRHLQHAVAEVMSAGRMHAVEVICKLTMLFLGGGAVAGALGFLHLGRIITPGILSAIMLAFSLFAALRVSGGALAVGLRTKPLQRLQMVQQHPDLLEKRAYRLLVWLAVLAWAARSLDRIGLLDPIVSVGGDILATKLERGSISVSIEDILAFGLTIWISFLLSRFIRYALQEEVYSRARVSSGAAYASSRLLHYTVMALGFLVGLGVLGMDLTKVSVMAGALGVGIGFGLQSVVNNFVCGLILLFERPVHVGDTIEVGDLLGEVRRIGFRASTVRTFQGSEIIVPNAQFITANVTNWTFSDRLRRIELPVGVSYTCAPKRVIELLEDVARSNPQILQYPAPQCLFMGYGDSSINFELRAWTDQFANFATIRSELNSAIYDAVHAAGMSFPFPQREVRLLRDPEAPFSEDSQPKL